MAQGDVSLKAFWGAGWPGRHSHVETPRLMFWGRHYLGLFLTQTLAARLQVGMWAFTVTLPISFKHSVILPFPPSATEPATQHPYLEGSFSLPHNAGKKALVGHVFSLLINEDQE